MNVSALIPVKGFANAKQRLSPLLSAPQREVLAEAMLRDVLRQVVLTRGLEETFVVTGNGRVSGIASSMGARVIQETEEKGETEAVLFALAKLMQGGTRMVLIIPADIPLVESSDLELLLGQVSRNSLTSSFALLVPSHDRLGTNALLLSPPDVIRPRFGYDSFTHHLGEVAAKGLPPRIIENERIALDIDEPRDLERFLSLGGGGSETYSKVLGMGVRSALLSARSSERL